MDKEVKNRFDDLNSYVEELSNKVKTGTKINAAVYSLLCIFVLIYAIYLPAEVKKYTSPEDGPATLIQIVEDQLPQDDEIIEQVKSALPGFIRDNVDALSAQLPGANELFSDSMAAMTDELTTLMEKESLPAFKELIREKAYQIKESHPDIKKGEAQKLFNQLAKEEFEFVMKKIMKNMNSKFIISKFKLNNYQKKDSELSNMDLAKKRIVLCFLKLSDDESYKTNLKESLMEAVDKYIALTP